MTSKKLKPLSSLLQQWASSSSSTTTGYNILLQSSQSLQTRVQVAETVENAHLYQRAGLRTPAEIAFRDFFGGSAWLQHLMELLLVNNNNNNNHCHVVWIRTTTTCDNQNAPQQQQPSSNTTITILNACPPNNPWGWDDEDEESPIKNLQILSRCIQKEFQKNNNTNKKVMLVWESLTPLWIMHGFEKTRRLLNSFSNKNCLQIWPVRVETLIPQQHALLEDDAHALLFLSGGEMTMIRQGIRETGNIVRETLPFQLVLDQQQQNEEDGVHYRLEERDEHPVPQIEMKEPLGQTTADGNKAGHDISVATTAATTTSTTNHTTTSSRPKIQLQLEEEHEQEKLEAPASSNRPRIFLQDDDPEFDDMDEEDPDDDLDI